MRPSTEGNRDRQELGLANNLLLVLGEPGSSRFLCEDGSKIFDYVPFRVEQDAADCDLARVGGSVSEYEDWTICAAQLDPTWGDSC